MDIAEIEKRIDRTIAAPMVIETGGASGPVPKTASEAMELAKMMAVSGQAVAKWLRGNPGGCLAMCFKAWRWGIDPFSVAEKSYVVGDHIGYESQLVHALIIKHAPLKSRLRHEIIGVDDERRCKVWGTFKGEDKPHEYTSETLGKKKATKKRNAEGEIKGSPLWDSDPEVQLYYSAVRQWGRLFCPDIILGVYSGDELEEPRDVTPQLDSLAQRLKDAKQAPTERGFDPAKAMREAQVHAIIEGEGKEENSREGKAQKAEQHHQTSGQREPTAGGQRLPDETPFGSVRDRDTGRREVPGGGDRITPREPTGARDVGEGGRKGKDPPPKARRR